MTNMFFKIAIVLFLPLVILAAMPGVASSLYAQPPPSPQEFRGTVMVNGSPPSQGATIMVRTGGTQIASVTTDAQGRYGFTSPLLVSASSGALLEFYVNGVKAQETATCKSGEMTTLNLTVNSNSSSQAPSPTITPAAVSAPAANFIISNLSISPTSVKPGEVVTVTADIKNSGGSEGSYKVVLKVNGVTEIEQTITLGVERTQKLMYTLSKEKAANYSVTINEQSSSFSVSVSEASWITSQPWWMYLFIVMGILLIILVIILLISRRNASYF